MIEAHIPELLIKFSFPPFNESSTSLLAWLGGRKLHRSSFVVNSSIFFTETKNEKKNDPNFLPQRMGRVVKYHMLFSTLPIFVPNKYQYEVSKNNIHGWQRKSFRVTIEETLGRHYVYECLIFLHFMLNFVTEVWHMAHFWVSYGRCTMPGSPMGWSEGLSRRWAA